MSKKHCFSERLKFLRQEKELRQHELAPVLNVSREVLSNYEQGRREPDYDTLFTLASYFDVSIDYLLGFTDVRKHLLNDKSTLKFTALINDITLLSKSSVTDLEKYVAYLRYRDAK